MSELLWYQYCLIGLIFVWSGFIRSGLGFGGVVLSLPFLLLVENLPQSYIALIGVHLMFFSSITNWNSHLRIKTTKHKSTVDWLYLMTAIKIMIIPKIVGVFGLIVLPVTIMSTIIFVIVAMYAITYILNTPFHTKNKFLDIIFLILGGYASGTSLIGTPLIVAVFTSHVSKGNLRDTLFVLWFILVFIKLSALIYAGVDLQLIHHIWLLPCAGLGHIVGLLFHNYILNTDSGIFFRVLGSVLLFVSFAGILKILMSG